MVVQTKKSVKFGGRNYTYQNITQLAKKIFGKSTVETKNNARKIITDVAQGKTKRYVIDRNTRNISKFDIRQKPIVLRDFGIERVSKKKIIQNNANISNLLLTNRINSNVPIRVSVEVKVVKRFNENFENKEYSFRYEGPSSELRQTTMQKVQEHFADGQEFDIRDIKVKSELTNQTFDLVDMVLRDDTPKSIDNLFNEVITNNKWKHCIRDAMKAQYPRFSKKNFSEMNTTNDIYEWCKEKNIKMTAYNIKGEMIKQNLPIKNSRLKPLNFIAYNNHLYLLKNDTLKKTITSNLKDILVENCHDKFLEIFNKGKIPTRINYSSHKITSFVDDKIRYFENEDYNICKKILNHFGIVNLITYKTNRKNIADIKKTLYVKECTNSCIPECNRFNVGGFCYNKYDYSDEKVDEDLLTIDKNLCYTHSLSELPFLLKTDYRHCKFTENPKDIIETNFYIVSVEKSTIFLPNKKNFVSGLHLNYCKKNNIDFKLLEEIECMKLDNYYKNMVKDILSLVDKEIINRNQAKDIINIMIGKMEVSANVKTIEVVSGIYNEDQQNSETGWYAKINGVNDYCFLMEEKKLVKINNEKLINVMIKEQSRRTLFEMMDKLKLTNDDIIQIKTDSITFKNKKTNVDKFINKDLDGWKYEMYKQISGNIIDKNLTFKLEDGNNNILGNCYAGCGKTYKILTEIYKDDTLVLTPSHACLVDYKKKDKNCGVIQKYSFHPDMIPKENTIIVDEIGMVDKMGHDFIYKMHLLKKRIICYGDFNQLEPIDNHIYNSKLYTKYMFGITDNMTANRRNKFSKEYYDKLIYNKNKKYLLEQVQKYNTEWEKAETIICYRNKTVDK